MMGLFYPGDTKGILVRRADQPISDTLIGEDELRTVRIFFEFFPQTGNEDTESMVFGCHVRSPNLLEKEAVGQDSARVDRQDPEELEFEPS
jgi:hypothetical protein